MIDAVNYLRDAAVEETARLGWEFDVDQSDRSEAVYVKVKRGEFWFGTRIASHEPFYECSADYQQVLVPRWVDDVTVLAEAERRLIEAVRDGGRVIADPQEISAALRQAWGEPRGRLSGLPLSGREQSLIRHRLNFRARWIYDETAHDPACLIPAVA